MALTEPDAGSSLADIKTTAVDTGEGYYKIKGQKIFISAGDTDAADNTIHLMLAKIEGAPGRGKGDIPVCGSQVPLCQGWELGTK